jgi:hypothetical protein
MDPAPPPRRGDPMIVAHRGAWGEAPQNSLAALEAAIGLGCDMVEIDVRRTRDGQIVAVHGARVAGAPVAVLDHAELKTRVRPGQAPVLAELLELAAGRVALDIELKDDGYAELVTAALARRLTPQEYVVTSFLASRSPLSAGRRPRPGPAFCCGRAACRRRWTVGCERATPTFWPLTPLWPAPGCWPGRPAAGSRASCGRSTRDGLCGR